ncbi:ABC transporter permease [Rhizocola hellebori]|uniref:ABC transporter permease n=1 Tax=Rhizocola hellebori TaxID=1392758 RepID=A0A8J3VLI0_9ACTN|nr:ABC transporter permease subunit [Rhizocola hellebori]GIH10855.1 ABC transporter permease [Rhizocola hellebori]
MADLAISATLPKPRPVSGRFLASELLLIFGRRRNWAGMAVLAAMPVIVSVANKIDPPTGGGGEGPDFFSAITSNGLFVALAALSIELPLFLPLAVATIAGDSIAGEANLGTLRYLLSVPVHRTRMLVVKFTAIVIFAFAATLLVAGTGVLMGTVLFGGGDLTLLSGTQISFGEGLLRLFAVCVYLAVCLSAVGAIGLFVSTLTEQPIGATIAIMILTVGSFILDNIPQLDWLHPYLLVHNWLNFGDLLRDPVAWDGISTGLLSAGAYILVFVTAAWARFSARDVTS